MLADAGGPLTAHCLNPPSESSASPRSVPPGPAGAQPAPGRAGSRGSKGRRRRGTSCRKGARLVCPHGASPGLHVRVSFTSATPHRRAPSVAPVALPAGRSCDSGSRAPCRVRAGASRPSRCAESGAGAVLVPCVSPVVGPRGCEAPRPDADSPVRAAAASPARRRRAPRTGDVTTTRRRSAEPGRRRTRRSRSEAFVGPRGRPIGHAIGTPGERAGPKRFSAPWAARQDTQPGTATMRARSGRRDRSGRASGGFGSRRCSFHRPAAAPSPPGDGLGPTGAWWQSTGRLHQSEIELHRLLRRYLHTKDRQPLAICAWQSHRVHYSILMR